MRDCEEIKRDFVKAFEFLYENNGMKGVSAMAVAEKAGYSRSSFYRTFDSVYDLLVLVEVSATPYQEMSKLLQDPNHITMEQLTEGILGAFEKKVKLIQMLTRHSNDNHYSARLRNCLKPVFLSQIKRVYILSEVEYDVLAEYITSAKLTLLRYWALNPEGSLGLGHLTQITDSMFEGRFWELVAEAAKASQEGKEFEKISLDYFINSYPWIEHRPLYDQYNSS